ncbi:MAG: hypothetical protein PVH84_09995, partial [Candidatus Aminicenantes bacterium]
MRNPKIFCVVFIMILITMYCSQDMLNVGSSKEITSYLKQEFDLDGERSPDIRYYLMETRIVKYELDGKRTGVDTYRLRLEYVPASISGKGQDEYICRQFTVQQGTETEVSIPALVGWSYVFRRDYDDEGRVFGIDHDRFENLETSKGEALMPDMAYFVYNTFIDFHAFCNSFAERTEEGKGIQDLKKIGDKIVHAASFTEPPVSLGSNVAEGSTFKNGEVTLEFKGISLVDDILCSLVAFDSGESSFAMIMQPSPEMEIKTVGSSHYKGDIFIDIESNWVQKVVMDEIVVSET